MLYNIHTHEVMRLLSANRFIGINADAEKNLGYFDKIIHFLERNSRSVLYLMFILSNEGIFFNV